jgi:ParB-like chromosome segregation protein Spo0J
MKIRCSYSKLVAPKSLKPHPKNPRRHSAAQIKLLSKIIEHQGWRAPIVVSNLSGFIVAGHARFEVAKSLGMKTVPVDYQDFASDADELAHLLADNRLVELGETDPADLSAILESFKGDLDLTGFAIDDLEVSIDDLPEPPPSVEETRANLEKIKAQRRAGNEGIMAKTDTEFYLVVMFKDRAAKQKLLRALQLPDDERYVPADSLVILPGRKISGRKLPKSAPPNKSGSQG